jgi:hypothetical protein
VKWFPLWNETNSVFFCRYWGGYLLLVLMTLDHFFLFVIAVLSLSFSSAKLKALNHCLFSNEVYWLAVTIAYPKSRQDFSLKSIFSM